MSSVKTMHDLDSIKKEFDVLLERLNLILKERRPNSNIYNTKLGRIKKDLDDVSNLDVFRAGKIAELVMKYNSINRLLDSGVEYNRNDFIRIVEGGVDYEIDSDGMYNDYFFELSMACRFIDANKGRDVSINLNSACDVIIDNFIAIECKYIHSPAGLMKNIRTAKKQVDKRVADGEAKCGFIALDLSHLCPQEKINTFSYPVFNLFSGNYASLYEKIQCSDSITYDVLGDKNFLGVISSYIMHETECALHSEFDHSYDLGENVLGIVLQSMKAFVFEYNGDRVPLSTRGMTYILNRKYDLEYQEKVKKLIHSLAVGI
ncbi:hypothetical protein [Klebsiella sp. BIGb0407]|uniref:hypothetical protein n=1 Tax=Klebsiella sp. BIGb0407 TaxID=2940603 RepID=UPI002167E0B1|nr:hypothetical protein [Klebsiella sp. BIGb0407]MCS3430012.1 hypothetical protein [Klebsiella sp. BIGb0407]